MAQPAAALAAIKELVRNENWRPDPHLFKQMARRGIQIADVLAAVRNARRAEPHDMRPLNVGGESWRIYGEDMDGRLLGIGIELVKDAQRRFVVILTVFIKESS